MPYCPECRDEYVVGIERCPDCEADLVDDLSSVPSPAGPDMAGEVEVVSSHEEESTAAAAAALLLGMSIPARVREAAQAVEAATASGWDVEVPNEYVESARRILRLTPKEEEAEEEKIRPEDVALLDLSLPALRRTGPEGLAGLVRLLVRGRGEIVGRAALRLARLGGVAEEALAEALVSAVAANSDEIPPAAVKAYQTEGLREIPPGLPVLIHDPKSEVRIRAIRTMAGIGGAAVMLPALELLRDAEESVREEAADAIWELSEGRIDLDLDRDPAAVEEDIRILEERYSG